MRSDTNLIKTLGIFGAVFVFLSLFMNVVTIKFNISESENAEYDFYLDETDGEEVTEEAVDVYVRYGLTLMEMRTVVKNYADDITWSKQECDEMLEELDSVDMSIYNQIFGMFGMEFSENTLNDLLEFLKYVVATSGLFLFLPFVIIAVCVAMLAGTVFSKKIIKMISTIVMIGVLVLMILPSQNFFSIMGIGPVILMCGIILSIISTIGSFVSPGVIYVNE